MDKVMIFGKNGWIGGKLIELLEGEPVARSCVERLP
jgi:hypothetical protein